MQSIVFPFLFFAVFSAQDAPSPPAATFQGGQISMRELDEYAAWKYGKREEGQGAQKHLLERALVEREAAQRGRAIAEEAVSQKLAELTASLGQDGLEKELREKQLAREDFLTLLRISMLHERMTQEDLGLGPAEKPSPEQLQLWITDRMKKAADIPAPSPQALGRTIRTLIGKKNTRGAILDLVGVRLLEGRAREAGVTIAEGDVDEEIAKRRAKISADPRYEGVNFEELLKTQGLTLADLKQSPALRAGMLLERITRANWPAERLAAEYTKDKSRWDGIYGESRKVSWILVRGAATPNQLTRRSLDEAAREAETMRGRINSLEDFQRMAKIYSEDDRSKAQGGEIGFVHRQEPQSDAALLQAIADAKANSLVGPVRLQNGAAILWVGETKPAPSEKELLEKILEEKRGAYYEEMMRAAKISTFLD